MPDLDYVVDCLELGDRAALALVLKDRRFWVRCWRQMLLCGPYFRAAGRVRRQLRHAVRVLTCSSCGDPFPAAEGHECGGLPAQPGRAVPR